MRTSEQINDVAGAMAKAQAEMKPAMKDSLNPAFRSKYADLTSVWEACRGPLTSHGLTVWQDVTTEERGVSVITRIAHGSGQWIEFGPLTVPLSKQDAHGVGSGTSYARRYALSAAVGIVSEEDDDGNAAVAQRAPAAKPEEMMPRPKTPTPAAKAPTPQPSLPQVDPRPEPEATNGMVKFQLNGTDYLTKGATREQMLITFDLVPKVNAKLGKNYAAQMLMKEFGVSTRSDLTSEAAEKFIVRLTELAEA